MNVWCNLSYTSALNLQRDFGHPNLGDSRFNFLFPSKTVHPTKYTKQSVMQLNNTTKHDLGTSKK